MYPCDQECSWNTYTGSVASRSVTTKTYDCQRHDEKSDPLVASFCAICNAMCSRHKYCKLIKQGKSGDMQFMHVIIAVTDTTHATILYKKRGVNCRRGYRNFRQGVQTFVKFWKAKKKKKKKGGEKTKEKEDLWWFFPFCRLYDINRLSRQLFTYKFITVGGMVFLYCNPLSTKHAFDMVVLILQICRIRGSGGPPPEKFWLKWCKIM